MWQPLLFKLVRAVRPSRRGARVVVARFRLRHPGAPPAEAIELDSLESLRSRSLVFAAVAAWPCAGGQSALLDLCHAFVDSFVCVTAGAICSDWLLLDVSVTHAEHTSAAVHSSQPSRRRVHEHRFCGRVFLLWLRRHCHVLRVALFTL